MSEQRITKVDNEKNPKRVEQGKRLAALSKLNRDNKNNDVCEHSYEDHTETGTNYSTPVIVGLCAVSGFLAYMYINKTGIPGKVANSNPDTPAQIPPRKKLISLDD